MYEASANHPACPGSPPASNHAPANTVDAEAIDRSAESRVTYGPAQGLDDLRQAFGLVHTKYAERGLVDPSLGRIFFGPYHVMPSAATLVGQLDGTVFTTLSVVVDSPAGLPLDSVFGDVFAEFRKQGLVLGELGLFADRRRSLTQSLSSMYELFRLSYWYFRRHDFDLAVIGVHPRHAGFYQRLFGFASHDVVRDHPTVKNAPAELLVFDRSKFNEISKRCKHVRRWLDVPVHQSVWDDRYRPSISDLVALTTERGDADMLDRILPHYRTQDQLVSEQSAAERESEQNVRRAG
jgi:hypothetical protein